VSFDALQANNSAVIGPGTALWFLGDVFAVPAAVPLANVFSIGDVLIALGGAWFVWAATRPGPPTRGRPPRRLDRPSLPLSGGHPPAARLYCALPCPAPGCAAASPQGDTMPQKIILDTDIGDDIDDALALGLILASPELDLVGVTTVFKNTAARGRQARTVLATAGRRDVPVAAGCGATLSVRLDVGGDPTAAYLAGELPNQDASCLPEAQLPPADPRHGVDFLIDTLMAGAGDIVVVTIGAMTNLAMALAKEPRLAARIPRIVSMAAAFDRQMAEWNIRCDPTAAALVLHSGVPVDLVGLDVTTRVQFRAADLSALAASPSPLCANLSGAIAAWARHSGWAHQIEGRPIMHDPLAVATLLDDSLVTWRRGRAGVELRGEATYGYTTFSPEEAGPHPTP
jgi:purine nucleosidase/pyrimidine-specific ribonucleoside hydrolase